MFLENQEIRFRVWHTKVSRLKNVIRPIRQTQNDLNDLSNDLY